MAEAPIADEGGAAKIRSAGDLVALIERQVLDGRLAPGQRLDPVRTTAQALGLAPNTVAAAYRTLGERGVLVGRGRRGTFVADGPMWSPVPDETLPDGLIDLTSGNPDPGLLPSLGPALAALDPTHRLYGAPAVDAALAELLVADLAADGVDATELAVVGGALDGLERVLGARLRPGDRVVVEDPGYPAVAHLVGAMGLRAVPVAVDGFGVDPASLALVLADGVEAIVVTPRAQNPTGAALDADRAAELRAVLGPHPEVVVIEDDHAGPIAGQPFHHLGFDRPAWATIRSMAKTFGPDLRLAALTGDAVTVGRVAGRQAVGAGWVSHLLQGVVTHLLSSAEVGRDLLAAAEGYRRRRHAVAEVLAAADHEAPARSGLNVWVPVPDEAQVVTAMERRGFAVRAGSRYRQVSPPGIRLSIGLVDEATAVAAAEELVDVLRRRPAGRDG
ncbi:MAG: aminotransferase class I/II-fold pyridoxal phosphate-dependent enzyme [Actinomycetota bacterium]